VILKEWLPSVQSGSLTLHGRFTGREMKCTVGFIFKQGFGCDLGEYVVMSLLFNEDGGG